MDTKELIEAVANNRDEDLFENALELLKDKKERDELIGFAVESTKNTEIVVPLLRDVFYIAGESCDYLGVAASATSLAIVLWAQDEKDGEIDTLLAWADVAQPDYSLLGLAKRMREADFEAETVKNAIEIAMAM